MTHKQTVFQFILRWFPAVLLMGTIFLFSSQPNLAPAGFNGMDFVIKKGGHILGYGLLFLAFLRGIRPQSRRDYLVALGFTILYAATDEFHQLFVQGRSGKVLDVFIDFIGAGLAWFCYDRLYLLRRFIHVMDVKTFRSLWSNRRVDRD